MSQPKRLVPRAQSCHRRRRDEPAGSCPSSASGCFACLGSSQRRCRSAREAGLKLPEGHHPLIRPEPEGADYQAFISRIKV